VKAPGNHCDLFQIYHYDMINIDKGRQTLAGVIVGIVVLPMWKLISVLTPMSNALAIDTFNDASHEIA